MARKHMSGNGNSSTSIELNDDRVNSLNLIWPQVVTWLLFMWTWILTNKKKDILSDFNLLKYTEIHPLFKPMDPSRRNTLGLWKPIEIILLFCFIIFPAFIRLVASWNLQRNNNSWHTFFHWGFAAIEFVRQLLDLPLFRRLFLLLFFSGWRFWLLASNLRFDGGRSSPPLNLSNVICYIAERRPTWHPQGFVLCCLSGGLAIPLFLYTHTHRHSHSHRHIVCLVRAFIYAAL